ncbi:MAG TPA: radical SAM protein [Patescibacteria group bacterium]|nr:radical SAM protein [Patescibacteria group bacterium]
MNREAAGKIRGFIKERSRSVLFGGCALEMYLILDYVRSGGRGRPTRKPRMIQIEPTRKCNLSCSMCLRRTDGSDSSMSFEFFREIISRDFDYRHFLLLYGQGEPFLAGDLFKMIRYERSRGNFVTTVTNGTIMDDDIIGEIVRSDLNMLRISLDGAGERTYNAVRRDADFNRVMSNIERLAGSMNEHRARPALALTFMAMKENYRDMPAMVRIASRLGIDYLEIKDLPPYADSPVKPLSVEMTEDADIRDDIEGTVRAMKEEAKKSGVHLIMTKFHCLAGTGDCMNPWFKTFVTWDGKVKVCSKLFAASVPAMGDLGEMTFDEIWTGPRYEAVRAKTKRGIVPFEECRIV